MASHRGVEAAMLGEKIGVSPAQLDYFLTNVGGMFTANPATDPTARRISELGAIDPATLAMAAGGSSGVYLDGLFRRLGLADAVRPKAVLVPGGLVAERLGDVAGWKVGAATPTAEPSCSETMATERPLPRL